MSFVILGLLLSEPLSLYDVRKRFAAGISLFYSASSGGIERALRRLVDDGHAIQTEVADTRRRKKLYAVTPAGRDAWRDWMLQSIAPSAESETVILAKVFLLGRLERRSERVAALRAIRARAVADLESLRELDTSVRASAVDLPPAAALSLSFQLATLTHGIRAQAHTLDWINSLLKEDS